MQDKTGKKERILDAAARVVEEQGAGHLTIDAVAAMAKISKGGVLYHYPNKDTLLRGMLDRVIESQRQRIETSTSPHGGAHAHVLSVLKTLPKDEWTSALPILAAGAENPELLNHAREYMRSIIDALRGTPHFAEAMMVIVAAEGQRIMDTLNLLPLDKEERQLLNNKIIEHAEAASK